MGPILRCPELSAFTGKKRSANYSDVGQSLLPPPVKIGPRAVGWPRHEIDAVMAARIAGKSNDDIRALVKRLVAERADALAAIRPDMAVQSKPGK